MNVSSSAGSQLAAAAENLIGCPYRFHGRNPVTGLDCIGLVFASLEAIGRKPSVPTGYNLRNASIDRFLPSFSVNGLFCVRDTHEVGDVVLTMPGPNQTHLLIRSARGGFIHAHAGLKRTVHTPGSLPWPAQQIFRLSE